MLFIGLTMPEVLGHSILFMLVGYDTTSNALTFTAYNLATHPECQEKLIQEIDEVLGKVRVVHLNDSHDHCVGSVFHIVAAK